MNAVKARVHNGRLVPDEPTDLSEGAEVVLVPIDAGNELDDDERAELDEALREGIAETRRTGHADEMLFYRRCTRRRTIASHLVRPWANGTNPRVARLGYDVLARAELWSRERRLFQRWTVRVHRWRDLSPRVLRAALQRRVQRHRYELHGGLRKRDVLLWRGQPLRFYVPKPALPRRMCPKYAMQRDLRQWRLHLRSWLHVQVRLSIRTMSRRLPGSKSRMRWNLRQRDVHVWPSEQLPLCLQRLELPRRLREREELYLGLPERQRWPVGLHDRYVSRRSDPEGLSQWQGHHLWRRLPSLTRRDRRSVSVGGPGGRPPGSTRLQSLSRSSLSWSSR